MHNEQTHTNELVSIIANEVIYLWDCACIPTCSRDRLLDHLRTLIKWWKQSAKNTPDRMSPTFQKKLDDTFDVAEKPKGRYNKEKALKYLGTKIRERGKAKAKGLAVRHSNNQDWTDDLDFYIDQMGPRLKCMGGVDSKLTAKERKLVESSNAAASIAATEDAIDPSDYLIDMESDEPDFEITVDDETDSDYQLASSSKEHADKDYITLKLPRDALKQLSPLAYRLQLSTRQQTVFLAGIIKLGDGSVKDTTLSVTSAHRQRHEGIKHKSKSIRDTFISNLPSRMVIHWDGKKIKYERKKKGRSIVCRRKFSWTPQQ